MTVSASGQPEFSRAAHNLGAVLMEMGRMDEATYYFRQVKA